MSHEWGSKAFHWEILWWYSFMISWYIAKMRHLMQNILLKCFKSSGNKHYMPNLKSMSSLLFMFVFRGYVFFRKGIHTGLNRLKVILSQQSLLRLVAFMGWPPSTTGSSNILASLSLPWLSAWRRVVFSGQRLLKGPFSQFRRGYVRLLSWLYPTMSSFLNLSVMLVGIELVWFSPKPSAL